MDEHCFESCYQRQTWLEESRVRAAEGARRAAIKARELEKALGKAYLASTEPMVRDIIRQALRGGVQ